MFAWSSFANSFELRIDAEETLQHLLGRQQGAQTLTSHGIGVLFHRCGAAVVL